MPKPPRSINRDRLDSVTAEINRAQATGSRRLDLSNLGLERIPEAVYKLEKIESIDFSGNELTHLGSEIWQLPALRSLNLLGNPLTSIVNQGEVFVDVPTCLGCWEDLRFGNFLLVAEDELPIAFAKALCGLDAIVTSIKRLFIGKFSLPIGAPHAPPSEAIQLIFEALPRFGKLESLSISGLDLPVPPPEITALGTLRTLSLNGLGIIDLPDLGAAAGIHHLSLVDNCLRDLPFAIERLERLRSLNLSYNPLKDIPKSIYALKGLVRLILRNCGLTMVPAEVLKLETLQELMIHGNEIEDPPAEIASNGLEAIKNYWRQRADAGVDYLCEAKLIILGEPGAGKTSLAKKIDDPAYQLAPNEVSTEGIDIIKVEFPTTITVSEGGEERRLERQFQVNIWDFGGQEIYHSTHQFFLTRRSVYLLVCDNRKEDTDFSYWLNIVEMLSESSPIFIIQNEKQDRTRDINLGSLRARFQNLRAALPTNLDTNRGLPELIARVKQELQGLPHVGAGLPATWKRVRQALERDARDYISIGEYFDICQQHGFSSHDDKLQLSSYLHDLGICLHFREDAVLKSIVILKPSWGTDAVYRVLDDAGVIAAFGKFSEADLRRIWHDEKYTNVQDELLQLMTKFQLCYTLLDRKTYIAPQLLSSEQSEYVWNSAGNMVVRYVYEFLPKGILTRLIVGLHHLIKDELVWKTGVVLERDQTRAEIIEEYLSRRIVVRVEGMNVQGLLAIIDEQLQRLHSTFHGISVNRLLPCQCAECSVSKEPYGFPLDVLSRVAAKGREIQCYNSWEMINAGELLRFIFPGLVKESLHQEKANTDDIQAAGCVDLEQEIFVSYAWEPESEAILAKLQETFEKRSMRIIRDREEMRYKESIRSFMSRIGRGKCIVLLISEKYLKSENCMFEILEIAKSRQFADRVFPIILPDSKLYKARERIEYVRYWEEEARKLNEAMGQVRGEKLASFNEELDLLSEIRNSFDYITATLKDMNALTAEAHASENFGQILQRVRQALDA